jgi:transport and Golgi organization protein 2
VCTVSWVQQPGGYHLLANRDEKRTRGRAVGPAIRECGGVRYIAPIDSDRGGTWIAANEFGVSVCLLNGDAGTRDSSPVPQRSRGLLPRELAWETTSADCLLSLRQLDLSPYAPFLLLILEPDRRAILADWDRERLTVDPATAQMPLTSSSFDSCGVRRFRLGEFARRAGMAGRIDPALLYDFHASHGASPDAYSPCMHREDAETVSFSWVEVTRHDVRFLYSPSAPCRWSPCEQKLLARAA